MRKPTFRICENKDADQLRGNREADQRLCFRYIDSMIPLLSKSEISSVYPSSVAVQPGLCRTRSETRMLFFSCRGSYFHSVSAHAIFKCSRTSFTSRILVSMTSRIIFNFTDFTEKKCGGSGG